MRRGLGFHARRSPGGFNPLSLFAGGVQGTWYDPSDLTTLFQDSAGTTPVTGVEQVVGRMLDKSGNGNHATATGSARPTLSARVNLLTRTEEFNVAPWTNLNAVSITANQISAPDGTLTADTITENTVNTSHFIRTEAQLAVASTSYTYSLYVKNNNADYITLAARGASSNYIAATFTLTGSGAVTSTSAAGAGYAVTVGSTTITSVGNGWFRCVLSGTMGTNVSSQSFFIALSDGVSAYGSDGIMVYLGTSRSVYIWGADLRPTNIGSSIPVYQRVVTATNYDSTAFPLYLSFAGAQAMSTPGNVNLSGTDKATVFAGVRKIGTAAGAIVESNASYITAGGMGVFANTLASNDYGAALPNGYITGTAYTAPITNVVTASFDIAAATLATEIAMRVNGATPTTATSGSANSGNFASLTYSIGARNNGASTFLTGNIYSLLVVGSAVSAGSITATETWVAGKTGITI